MPESTDKNNDMEPEKDFEEKSPEIIDADASRMPERTNLLKKAPPRLGAGSDADSDEFESPSRIIHQGMWIVFIFFGIFGVWAYFGHISGAVVAQGTIKIENERKIVQHLEGGIVDDILVKEGEEVNAGQPLVVLESVSVDANANMTRKQALDLEARQVRLKAEKDQAPKLVWPEATRELAESLNGLEVLDNEEKIFKARRSSLNTQVALFKSQIAQLDEQIKSFETQIKAERRIMNALQDEISSKKRLLKDHYLDKSQILNLDRNLASHEGTLGRLRQSVAEAKQKGAELNLRIVDTVGKFMEDTIKELGNVENELIQARERIRPLADAKKRLQITAPIAGKVVGLKVHSKGGVVKPGETLMDIVPENHPLVVETQVPVNKITEVYPGQEANIQLDAFDVRFDPRLSGKVTYVSADRLTDGGYSGPYYLCYVEVDPASLAESELYISPGMPATVYIMTVERTVLYYMFEPLIKGWQRALRD